jgi:hypothetical protein
MAAQRLAGLWEGFQPVMDHAPDVGQKDVDTISDVAQTFDKAQAGHGAWLDRAGGAARQRGVAGQTLRLLGGNGLVATKLARSVRRGLALAL